MTIMDLKLEYGSIIPRDWILSMRIRPIDRLFKSPQQKKSMKYFQWRINQKKLAFSKVLCCVGVTGGHLGFFWEENCRSLPEFAS